MSTSISSNPKRRPVDLLFGEADDVALAPNATLSPRTSTPEGREARDRSELRPTPSYMVEPPRPPTILRPPPPQLPADWRLSSPVEPPAFVPGSVVVKNASGDARPQAAFSQTPGRAATSRLVNRIRPTAPSRAEWHADLLSPSASSAPVSDEYERLASLIDTLYEQVSEEVSDSPKVSEYCLSLLRDARSALKREEYEQAEYKTEQVKDRVLRARASAEAERSSSLKLIWGWEIILGLGAVVAILLPFYLALAPSLVPLLRAVALGALGGIMLSMWNLTRLLHNREYDPAHSAAHWASPLKGASIAVVIFFLSVLGIFAAPGALGVSRLFGSLSGVNLLMYVIALLAGITQNYIFDFWRGGLAAVLGSPRRVPAAHRGLGHNGN